MKNTGHAMCDRMSTIQTMEVCKHINKHLFTVSKYCRKVYYIHLNHILSPYAKIYVQYWCKSSVFVRYVDLNCLFDLQFMKKDFIEDNPEVRIID